MTRRRLPSHSFFETDRGSEVPLQKQLYDQIRHHVLNGTLRPRARLPSSRALSQELGVSRNTVIGALEQLIAEGYLATRGGSGTFVASELPEEHLSARSSPLSEKQLIRRTRISSRAQAVLDSPVTFPDSRDETLPFRPSIPSYDLFPLEVWAKIAARTWRDAKASLLGYGDPAGYRPLRENISAYLREYRGVFCSPDQVIVTSGSQQALDLAARVLVDTGDSVCVEDPGYLSARSALVAAGAKLQYMPIDNHGATVPKPSAPARLYYITPSYQYPLGITMSLKRRFELLEWAERQDAWLVEDDYDAEFRYSGRPIPAIQGLDSRGRVIYIGTFSKVLLPGLRLGYVVVPPALIESFIACRRSSGRHSQLVDQAVLSEFIQSGALYRHIRRMRVHYAERQRVTVETFRQELAGYVSIEPADAGMHLKANLKCNIAPEDLADEARRHGVVLVPLSGFSAKYECEPGFLIGYPGFSPRRIRDGVKRLKVAFDASVPGRYSNKALRKNER